MNVYLQTPPKYPLLNLNKNIYLQYITYKNYENYKNFINS